MEKPIKIRLAEPSDIDQIRKVHQSSIRQLCRKHYPPRQIQAWSSGIKNSNYLAGLKSGEKFWVAVQGRKVLGFSILLNDEIRAVYIHPRFVGQGIGKRLLIKAEKWSRKHNFRKLNLKSSITAQDFYKSQGWNTIRWGIIHLRNDVKIRCILMKKRI